MDEHKRFVRRCTSSDVDIELCYQTFGNPLHPCLLLVGGLNMQSYAWDEQFCDELVRRDFFVVRFDNRDIGHSTKIEGKQKIVPWKLFLPKWLSWGEELPYSLEDMALDALALLDSLGIGTAHVMGVSMGGMIAQLMAILAPERVLTLTIIMSSTNAKDLPHPALWVKLWMLRKPAVGVAADRDQLVEFRMRALQGLLYGCVPVDEDYLKKRIALSLNRSAYAEGLLRQAGAIMRTDSRDDDLRRVFCPSLVIHGQNDVLCRVEHGYRLAKVLPNSKLVVFQNMGHHLNPAYFDAIVDEFLSLAARRREYEREKEAAEAAQREKLNVVSRRYEDVV